jgi:hypothetical protein
LQKFFGSFFQKRTSSAAEPASPPIRAGHPHRSLVSREHTQKMQRLIAKSRSAKEARRSRIKFRKLMNRYGRGIAGASRDS